MSRLQIDTGSSMIAFRGQSTVHPITATAHPSGWFDGIVDGAFDPAGSLAGYIEVPVNELVSGNPFVDRETRRRLDARHHPYISGQLTDTVDLQLDRATVEGTIELTGESALVEGDLHVTITDDEDLVLSGEGTFDVRWWGMEPPRLLMLKVEPEVEVSIRLVLITTEG